MVRVEGLVELDALLKDIPVRSRKRVARALVIPSIRSTRRRYTAQLKRKAPKNTGRLSRSMNVWYNESGGNITLLIQGSRALVPQNAETGFVSRTLRDYGNTLSNAMQQELQRWIERGIRNGS